MRISRRKMEWARVLLIVLAVALGGILYYEAGQDDAFPGAQPIRAAAAAAADIAAFLVNHRDTRHERAEFPDPAQRHLPLKELLLELTNERREAAGAPPVRMGDNPAAQLHSEAALDGCYSSHWDRWGLKPQHRYSLAGGAGAGAENVTGLDYCVKFLDARIPILSMEKEVAEIVAAWMCSPDHRRVLLDPAHTTLNIGIAHDRFNANVVQHFASDYVRYDRKPALDPQGILRFSGEVSGAALEIGDTLQVQVAYDPPPRYLTTGQLAHTYALCNPLVAAYLVQPPPPGTPHAAPETRTELTWQKCVNPYDTPADHPRPDSPAAANKALTAALAASDAPEPIQTESLRITADRMDIAHGKFDVRADLTPVLNRNGPGIYTVRLWGMPLHMSQPALLSEQSVFWQTAPPQGAPY